MSNTNYYIMWNLNFFYVSDVLFIDIERSILIYISAHSHHCTQLNYMILQCVLHSTLFYLQYMCANNILTFIFIITAPTLYYISRQHYCYAMSIMVMIQVLFNYNWHYIFD